MGTRYDSRVIFKAVRSIKNVMPVHDQLSEEDTAQLARKLAGGAASGDVFLLNGTLGAGKSTFARSFIRHLSSAQEEVPSPTFTLVQTYDIGKGSVWHFDLYRIKSAEEIFDLGWEDALAQGIVLVEWPERLGPYTPKDAIRMTFEVTGANTRRITIT
jgi:tRNA threonylcarbamoyladenosine biosynthesis protein TsaE